MPFRVFHLLTLDNWNRVRKFTVSQIVLFTLLSSSHTFATDSLRERVTGYGAGQDYGLDSGAIIKVTTLAASGPGSLKAAIDATGPRVVVFEVGGVIDLARATWSLSKSDITIAGQTAPSPGITLVRGALIIEAHNVLIQHIAVRVGDDGLTSPNGWEPDSISIGRNSYGVVLDHVSASWGIDEVVSVSSGPILPRPYDITISNCLIAEGLKESIHSKGEHSKGTLIGDGVKRVSLIRNFWAHNHERSPRISSGSQAEAINNLIYNPGFAAITIFAKDSGDGASDTAIIGNRLVTGMDSRPYLGILGASSSTGSDRSNVEVFSSDNLAYSSTGTVLPLVADRADDLLDADLFVFATSATHSSGFVAAPASQNDWLTVNVGSRPKDRDPVDQRIVQGYFSRTGRHVNSQSDIVQQSGSFDSEGYPAYPASYRSLTIPSNLFGDADDDGVNNLEEWLTEYTRAVEYSPVRSASYRAWIEADHPALLADRAHPSLDPDGDSSSNLLEFALRSDPESSSDQNGLNVTANSGAMTLSFERPLDVDLTYEVQTSSNLINWIENPSGSGVPDETGKVEISVTPSAEPKFFRVLVTE